MKRWRPLAAAGTAVAIAGAAAAAFGLNPATASALDESPPTLSNRETVNIKMDARGEVDVMRIYDQITITGTGRGRGRQPGLDHRPSATWMDSAPSRSRIEP